MSNTLRIISGTLGSRRIKTLRNTDLKPTPEKLREKMGQAAVKASEFIGYEGAGTVEFLVDKNRDFYFSSLDRMLIEKVWVKFWVKIYDSLRSQ